MKEKRFYIDCYGICDTWKGKVDAMYCSEKKLTWEELCDTLNDLYENVDTDVQMLLIENNMLREQRDYYLKKLQNIKSQLQVIVDSDDDGREI